MPTPNGGWAVLRRGLGLVATAARERSRAFTAGVAGSVVFAAATVGSAYVLSAVITRMAAPVFLGHRADVGTAIAAAGVVLLVAAVKIAGILVRRLAVGHQQFGLVADYRRRVLRRYLDLPYSWHLRQSPGTLMSTASSDVDATWFLVAGLPLAVGALTICVLAAGALLFTDPVLAAVGIAVFPVLVLVNVLSSRRLVPHLTAVQQRRAELAGIAGENVDGAHVVRALGRAEAEVARFEAAAGKLYESSVGAARVRAVFGPLSDGLPFLGSLALLMTGALRLRQGAIGIEELLSATFLFSGIAFPLAGLGWLLGLLPNSVVGWQRVRRVLDVPVPPRPGAARSDVARSEVARAVTADRPAGPARLEVRGVAYRYDGRRAAVEGVDLTVAPGRTLAIAGTTGAGKSTLARLISGLVEPDAGAVLLDGVDVGSLHPRERAPLVGYVPQETFLFAGTVRENLVLDHEPAFSDAELWTALRTAQAEEFVAALAGGLDGVVGERGAALSGGQRQRLALARAFVRRPALLVLDDATSGLDPRVETAIVRGLPSAFPTTTVVITDRHESLAAADEVVFLDAGRLVASGHHRDLLTAEHDYARLVLAHGARA